jgi:glucose-1-phosphate adenylyltransferase
MAGGEGTRLRPLTYERAKAAVYFGGKYRIIDFILNNFINSEFYQIKVLTQYKADSLIRHLSIGWPLNPMLEHYIDPVPAQMQVGEIWYRGTADSVFQNLKIVEDKDPDYIAVFGGDHIFKMHIGQMLAFHIKKKAAATIAAIPFPIQEASEYGIIEMDRKYRMIGFQEKPKHPKPIPKEPNLALASMGNYIFNKDFIIDILNKDSANKKSSHDFGKDIIPSIFAKHPVYVYDFRKNRIPGEKRRVMAYWKDVGTLKEYWKANMDLTAADPEFNIYNKKWPLRTFAGTSRPPVKFTAPKKSKQEVKGEIVDSIIASGCTISGAKITRTILSNSITVKRRAELKECILFPNVVVNRACRLNRVIVDKAVELPEGLEIGFNPALDKKRFHVADENIVVVTKEHIDKLNENP